MCSYFYFLFDNIIWLHQIQVLERKFFPFTQIKWKKFKDAFSLYKAILEVISSIYTVYKNKEKEAKIQNKLENHEGELIRDDHECYVLMRNLIMTRRQTRFQMIEILIYSMRFIMLVSALKLVGHKYLDPIFVSLCGLITAGLNVFKSLKSKKNFFKLT